MKKYLFVLLNLGIVFLIKAQSPTLQWAESFPQTTIRFITADAAGNTYISGSFNGTVDFDPGPSVYNLSSLGGDDAFFIKLNSAGNMVWAKRLGASSFDDAESIAVDNSGNVYITGGFGWTVDFDPGPGVYNLSSGSTTGTCYCNAFVLKLDALGNFVWAGKFDSFIWSYGYSIKVDAASNVYLTGGFQFNIDLDPSAVNNYSNAVTSQDTYLIKLNSSGNFVWGETFGIIGMSRFFDMDSFGNFYWPGSFSNTADFDPGPGTSTLTSAGNNDCFILKLNNLGNLSWVKQIGGTGNDGTSDLKLDGTGNMYVIGSYQNTVDLDPGVSTFTTSSAGSDDIFILKLNSGGNFIWAKTIGSIGSEGAYSLVLDPAGSPIFSGSFQNTLDFDPGPGTFNISPIGSYEAYFTELSSSGNFIGCFSLFFYSLK